MYRIDILYLSHQLSCKAHNLRKFLQQVAFKHPYINQQYRSYSQSQDGSTRHTLSKFQQSTEFKLRYHRYLLHIHLIKIDLHIGNQSTCYKFHRSSEFRSAMNHTHLGCRSFLPRLLWNKDRNLNKCLWSLEFEYLTRMNHLHKSNYLNLDGSNLDIIDKFH